MANDVTQVSASQQPSYVSTIAEFLSNFFMKVLVYDSKASVASYIRKNILELFNRIEIGQLILVTPDGVQHCFGSTKRDNGQLVTLKVKSDRLWGRLLINGDLGLAEAYLLDECDISDITKLLELLVNNKKMLISKNGTTITNQLSHAINYAINTRFVNSILNTISNIATHYDLGNDMFTSFLDPTMSYSCPLWYELGQSGDLGSHEMDSSKSLSEELELLEEAQLRKIRTLIRLAELKPSEHLLEIGSGWGSLAIEAVRLTGCRVTAITLSEEQKAYADGKIAEAGFSGSIEVKIMDYRELLSDKRTIYDKIISVEMMEHVGHQYMQEFFKTCHEVLNRETGLMVFQCITLHDVSYASYLKQVDYIQKYIFPGGQIPSISHLVNAIYQGSDSGQLVVHSLNSIGSHYTKALRLWRLNFIKNFDQLHQRDPKKYNLQFKRIWEYYFSYCEAGFKTHSTGDVISVLSRPNNPIINLGIPQ